MKFEVEFKLLERWYKEPNITTIDVNVDDEKEYLMQIEEDKMMEGGRSLSHTNEILFYLHQEYINNQVLFLENNGDEIKIYNYEEGNSVSFVEQQGRRH